MILIFTENNSYSSRYVTRYLYKMKQTFDLFLETDYIDFNYDLSNGKNRISIYKNGQFLCFYEEIKSVWAHRSDIKIFNYYQQVDESELEYSLGHHITQKESIRNLLHKKKCLGRFGKLNFNKLVFLNACQQLDIKVPNSLVTRKKSDLGKFLANQKNGIIVKSIAANFHFCVSKNENEQTWMHGITNALDIEKYRRLPEEFDLSLFQEKLDKKFELRVLFIAGICYPQVIFSQKISQDI